MAFPASFASPSSSTPKFPINVFEQKPCQPKSCFLLHLRRRPFSSSCIKAMSSMAQFGEPSKENKQKQKIEISVVKDKLWEAIPVPVKELPWKKAADTALEQLLLLGYKALKWSFISFGVLSFLSDVIFSISRNYELIMPFGLFVGCFLTDVLKEALQQVLPSSEESGLEKHFLGIGCFLAAVKFVSAGLPMQARVFLLHVANGGFVQVLWLWRGLLNKRDEDASLPMDVKS
ncbi:hypothetical protein GBA52_015518 [Prunus armeniaca]|nr:hypothetical protein GBA52_015518 [Prunus armeniaca]